MNLEQLAGRLRDSLGADDPLAQEVMADMVLLTTRKASGDDTVDAEIPHVQAAALNLTAEAQQKVAQAVNEWFQEATKVVISGVLAAI